MSMQGATLESVMGTMVTGFACVSLLGCLLMPLGFLTMQFRTLTFRETAVLGGTVRGSVKHTWQIVKANLSTVIILVALMWGVDYIFGMVTSLITLPLGAVTAVSFFSGSASSIASSFITFLSLTVTLLLALPKAMLYAFIGIAWTLAFLDIAKDNDEQIEA
jgi:hypothetical protein